MKNTIKIITILLTVTSFFPIHSMVGPNGHILELDELRYVNPLLHMSDLTVMPFPGGHSIPDDDQFFTQNDLALKLAIIKFFEESDRIKNKETLQTICHAVSEGTPITSKHIIAPNAKRIAIFIVSSQNSKSVFMLTENWLKLKNEWFADKSKKDDFKAAIFQGERKRKERLDCIGSLLEPKVPKNLIPVFLSYLSEYNVSEERTALIEQAEQEFHQKKQSQFSLFKISAYFEKAIKNITDCE